MLAPLQSLDRLLLRWGLSDPWMRGVVCRGVIASLALIAVGGILSISNQPIFLGKNLLLLWFGVGSLLSVVNFYALAKYVFKLTPTGWSLGSLIRLLVQLYARLFFTGIVLYICLVWYKASGVAIIAGLSALLLDLTISGLVRFAHAASKKKKNKPKQKKKKKKRKKKNFR